jgi:hypothetical protein
MLLEKYVEEVNGRVQREVATLARGGAKSYEEYLKAVATINALTWAVETLRDQVNKVSREDRP